MSLHIIFITSLILSISSLFVRSDAQTTTTSLNNSFNCTFEKDICGWTQAQDDDFDWERVQGLSAGNNRSTLDHTTKSAASYYMSTNSEDHQLTQKARLISPIVNIGDNQSKCFHFYYLMHGAEIGALNVYLGANSTVSVPLWSRIGTQGIFYLKGQVTIYWTSVVVIEGSGSSGNQADLAIDDVSLTDGPCTSVGPPGSISSLACDFELDDVCGYRNIENDDLNWRRSLGKVTENLKSSFDHTTRTASGGFMILDEKANNRQGSLRSPNISAEGSYCLTFFYREHGGDVGSLSVSMWDYNLNNEISLWKDDETVSGDEWNKIQVSLSASSVIQISFDAIITQRTGDVSIDDISVVNGSCEIPPVCDFDEYDLCSWKNDYLHDKFDWEIATFESDAQLLSPWRDADNHTAGGYILLDMANNPSGTEAYLVSEIITAIGTQCFEFYYYPMTKSSLYESIPMRLNIYVITGAEFPGSLYWSYSMTKHATMFAQGKLPIQMNQEYRLVIGGYVTLGQVLSLDKFSLSTTNCTYTPLTAKPPVQTTYTTASTTAKPWKPTASAGPRSPWDCDFETDSCDWRGMNSLWIRRQAGVYQNGPLFDHTKGPGYKGYFMTMDTGTDRLQSNSTLKASTNYCLMFWYYMYGPTDFEFLVEILQPETTTVVYKHGSMDTDWHQMALNLPPFSNASYIQFNYGQSSIDSFYNEVALDDIHIYEGKCDLEGGPDCTFDRGFCGWTNSKINDFNFTSESGANQSSEMIDFDHTTGADLGVFIKAEAASHSEGQSAHFESPKLPFNDSVCMRFYYFVTPLCDSGLSIETLGPQDKHYTPLLDLQDISYGTWQIVEVTIFDPQDIQVIITVTIGHNKTGEVGIDDVTFVDGECSYAAFSDFEKGFDALHNVYSNDFNWVIASPSDGIFPWLPAKDYSTNSPQGHFAVASYNSSSPAGKKAELWSQLYQETYFECTSFYLYVYGSDPGTLNVTLVDYMEDTRTVVWSYTPTPGSNGTEIHAQFPHAYPSKFYVVFTVVMSSVGGWALDSLITSPSSTAVCPARPTSATASTVAPPTNPPPLTTSPFVHAGLGECDFEVDMCDWYIPNDIYFNWNRTNGDSTLEFAPKQGRPGGKMYFLALPRSASPQTALLRSQRLNNVPPDNSNTVQLTLRFWLNMAGLHIGEFFIVLETVQSSDTIYYRNQTTNSWEQMEISVSVTGPFFLTLEGRRGSYDLDSVSVDDIELSYSTVVDDDTIYSCTFESSDLCGFKQDNTEVISWYWHIGSSGEITADHTTRTAIGHMVWVPPFAGSPGSIARLVSKTVPPMSGCLTFWLMMNADGAAFRVYISSDGQEELIFQKLDSQGIDWIKSEVPVSSNGPFTIVLEVEELNNRSSAVAVDDFSLSSEACNTQGACSFERDMCAWQNTVTKGDDFDWIRGSGNTVGAPGPLVDSTLGSSDGYYMYIDSSGPYKYQQRAWLDSDTFPKEIQCLHFHYNMRGASVGTLNVYTVLPESDTSTLVWSLSGDQGDDWKSAMVTVGANFVNYYIRFEGTLGYSVTSNIAIDDITFLPDACKIQPATAKVFITISTTQAVISTTQSPQTILINCDFNDVSLCGFKNGISDNRWLMSSHDMPVSGTLRPFNGHTSDASNPFIYAQVDNGLLENATARFISPVYSAKNGEPKCLEFYYHMNGDQVGQLNVYIVPDGQENSPTKDMLLWSQNFDAGPGWKVAHVPILQASNYHIIFEAIRSKFDYYYGIDDLTIYDNVCGPTDLCDFENDLCLWSNDGGETSSNADFFWKRYHGQERSANFAPVIDHTWQTVTGHYMLVESSLADTGSVARLYSQAFASSNSPYCFRFWYYMFGDQLGQLKVYVRNSISSTSTYSDAVLWNLDAPAGEGSKGDAWYLAQVNISKAYTQKPFMVIVEATVGSTLQGAFGIDDTHFEMSECRTQPSAAIVTANVLMVPDCDFEDGNTCDWTSPQEWFKFAVTDTGGAIPFDHRGGTGKYILADSNSIRQNTSVVLQSALLPPTFGTNCLTLWYNLQDSGMSYFSLHMVTWGSDYPLWRAYSDNNNEWSSMRINIQSKFDYQLLIIAIVGLQKGGSVAVDDITMTHGACLRSGLITFEDSLSGFTPTDASNIKWILKMANNSFVLVDHTYNTSIGHVLQADLGSTTATLKVAEVQSPLYPSAGDECLEFWYAKRGSSGGWLSVQISGSGPGFVSGDSAPLWVTTAATNGNWNRALVDISSEYPYWIKFQATANNSQVNDSIVIDDISFIPDSCPSPVTCDFDLNTCGYASPQNNPIIWQAVKGVYSNTLMPYDQTLQSDQGVYFEVDFPGDVANYTADLFSPIEKQMNNKCLIFWYYGSGEGSLQVFVQTSPNQHRLLVTKTFSADMQEGRLYRSWKNVQVDVNSTAPYTIMFEAKSQKPWTSVAIDSIELINSTCANLTNTPSSQPSTTSLLDPKKALLGCDFEDSSFCNFTSGNSKSFSWKLFSFDSSHYPQTGVDYDHTKFNKYGHHVYMDASGQKFNATAQLISPTFVNDKFVCLSFYYAMYGRDVNRLNVYVSQGQADLYWTRSGNQGEGWHHQLVEIGESPQPTQLIFEGVVGSSNEGDIDLDDIWIFDGRCPPPENCDFEDSEMCKMDQDNLDEADWSIQLANLATGFNPKTDHTYGTGEGHYLVLDMSKTKSGDKARIFTQQYTADSVRCLSFWFHLTNPPFNHSHNLTVTLQDERGIGTPLDVLRGFFKDNWTPAIFPLQPTENFQIIFEGQSGGSVGSIAIDDIMVSPEECQSYIDCDFESHDMCGWEPVPGYSTPPWEVIPPNRYMVLNFTGLPNQGVRVSKVKSLIIPPGLPNHFCLTFDYMTYGANAGFLNVSLEIEYPTPQSFIIFSIYGNMGNDIWRYALGDNPQIDLGTSRFVITGTTAPTNSSTETALILISDINLVFMPCKEWQIQRANSIFACNASSIIPMTSVCDFMPDCIGNSDEQNCGACDFEKDYCKWKNDGTGAMKFTAVASIPNIVFTDAHPGIFLTLQRSNGISGGYADLVQDQELGPSPYNCSLIFSYYMSLDSQSRYGNLYVSIEENNVETVVWESSYINNPNWQTASVDIGSIHSRFKIHISVKYLPFDNAIGIDDIKFSEGCMFTDKKNMTCATEFKCISNGACIDNTTKLCDFTNECWDGSDETPFICGGYLMDNFEESFGDWSQDNQDDFDWSRHSGRWISLSGGPRRDHTLGTHFGHYLIFEGETHSDGQVARLVSPEFLPTQNSDCKIRFYYHMHGSNKGQLTLYIRSIASGKMQQIGQYFTTLTDSWLFGSDTLTSSDIFQVVFEGKVIGQHSTDIGLDDVTFTPQCQLKNPGINITGTSTARVGSVVTSSGNSGQAGSSINIGITTSRGGTVQPVSTVKTSSMTKSGSASKHTTLTPTRKQPTKAAMAASSNSDSWKVPVGVVLGLLSFAAIIGGTFIYLKRTQKLTWATFPLLRKSIKSSGGDCSPIIQYETTGDSSIAMTVQECASGPAKDNFDDRNEPDVMVASLGTVSNPLYKDVSEPSKDSSDV